jgi:hypothetical protein
LTPVGRVGRDGRHDGDLPGRDDRRDRGRRDRGDVADEAEVDLDTVYDGSPACAGEQPVGLARQGLRERPVLVDEGGDFRADLRGEHVAHDLERFRARHAEPAAEFTRDAAPRKLRRDLGASAVHDDGMHADLAQVDHVLGERAREILVDHGVAAELHDDRLALELPEPRDGLDERLGLRRRVRTVRSHQLAYALFSCT